jgi:hypothetical protein
MMAMQISRTIRASRKWLIALMLLLSALVWLSVSSNRNNILHTIGKLGPATRGYGTVNLPFLLMAVCWSMGGCLIAAIIYDIDIKSKRLVYLFLGMVVVAAAMAALGIFFDERFSTSLFPALAMEPLELIVASLIGWIFLFKPSDRNGLSDLVGSVLFGLFGLIFVTSLGLLICPRVSFRF